jgi:hypothetical protein
MTTKGFIANHAANVTFTRGLYSFFEYRDLDIKQATRGRVVAHVLLAAAAASFPARRTCITPNFSSSMC